MATKPPTRLIDYLPPPFREDEVAEKNFLGDFLQSFETVFEEIQQELDAIPQLFSLAPTPSLAVEVTEADLAVPQQTLHLDSAAGLYPGDVIQLESGDINPNLVEFAVIESVSPALIPQTITLSQSLRFPHPKGTPLRVIETTGPQARLSLPVSREGQNTITIVEAPDLRVTQGDVLRLEGNDGAAEYALVVGVVDAAISLTPALQNRYGAGQPVIFMSLASETTPPPDFATAVRTGPDLILQHSSLKGERFIELDTFIGLRREDVLYLHEPDSALVEFAQIATILAESSSPEIRRKGIQLKQPLQKEHKTGLGIKVLITSTQTTQLIGKIESGAEEVILEDADAWDVVGGDVLRIGEGNTAEYVKVLRKSGQAIKVAPALKRIYSPGAVVTKMVLSGSGTTFLRWLSSWIGLSLHPERGERWNRELLLLAGRILPWRGTKVGVEAFLNAYLRGEATVTVFDRPDPLQIDLLSTVGVDTVINGNPPYFFWVKVFANQQNTELYNPDGIERLIQTIWTVLLREQPAHTSCALKLQAQTMQIGVDAHQEIGARVGVTTLLWGGPKVITNRLVKEEEAP